MIDKIIKKYINENNNETFRVDAKNKMRGDWHTLGTFSNIGFAKDSVRKNQVKFHGCDFRIMKVIAGEDEGEIENND